ncbi:hypothetical protein VIGAN_07180400, partial [Vigna angularis var. angularis]
PNPQTENPKFPNQRQALSAPPGPPHCPTHLLRLPQHPRHPHVVLFLPPQRSDFESPYVIDNLGFPNESLSRWFLLCHGRFHPISPL